MTMVMINIGVCTKIVAKLMHTYAPKETDIVTYFGTPYKTTAC